MGILDIFKSKQPEEPEVSFAGQPVSINAEFSVASERMAARLGRLMQVETPSQEVIDQIANYQDGLTNMGLAAPATTDEVDALILEIREGN